MTSSSVVPCECRHSDPRRAKRAILRAPTVARIIDESHFGVSVRRCPLCSAFFLTMFGERVDWVDSDDPQTWVGTEIAERAAAALLATPQRVTEQELEVALRGVSSWIYHDMPKGSPEVIEWRSGNCIIPAHD